MPTIFDNDGFDVEPQQPEQGNFSRGLSAGWASTKGAVQGAIGLGADAIGADNVRDWALDKARANFAKVEALHKPTDEASGVESLGDLGAYLAHTAGELGPTLAQIPLALVTGGAGAGTILGKQAIQGMVERAVARGVSREVAEQAAASTIKKLGADAAFGVMGATQGAGTLYPTLRDQGDEDAVGKSLGYGSVAGALGIVPGMRVANKLVGGGAAAVADKTFLRRLGQEGLAQGALGAATGLGQNVVNREALGLSQSGDDAFASNLNAAIGGGISGALLSPLAALHRNPVNPTRTDDPQPLLGGANPSPKTAPDFRDPGIPTRDWVDQTTGVRAGLSESQRAARESDLTAAFNEPTAFRKTNENGVETGPVTLGDLYEQEVNALHYARPDTRALTQPAASEFQARFLGQRADPGGPIHLLGENPAPQPGAGVVGHEAAPSFAALGADAYRRQQAGELLSPFEALAARQFAGTQAPELEIPQRPNLKPSAQPPAPIPARVENVQHMGAENPLAIPAESDFQRQFLGQQGQAAAEPVITPAESVPSQSPNLVLDRQRPEDVAIEAMRKAARGELLSAGERDLVRQMSERLADQTGPQLEVPPAREARQPEEPAQQHLPGIEPPLKEATPQLDRAVEAQEARGTAPEQREMFGAKGEPTYAAAPDAEPNYRALAEAVAKEAKYSMTERRRPLAEQIERFRHDGTISEDDAVRLHNALGQSKYAYVEKALKEAPVEHAAEAERAKHGVTEEQTRDVERQERVRKEAEDTWNESFREDEGDPAFKKLSKEHQDEWTKLYDEGKATVEQYDRILSEHEGQEWGRSFSERSTPESAASSAERLSPDVIRENNTGDKMVDWLQANAQDPLVRDMMKYIARKVDLSKVRLLADSPAARDVMNMNERDRAQLDASNAVYSPRQNAVVSRVHNEVTLAHELLHAATEARINADPVFQREFGRMLDAAKRGLEKTYGKEAVENAPWLENVHEFLAYSYSDRAARNILSSLRMPGDKAPSVWDRFVSLVRRMFGLPDRASAALDRLIGPQDRPLLEAMDEAVDKLLSSTGELVSPNDRLRAEQEWKLTPKEAVEAARTAPKEFAKSMSIDNLGRARRGKLAMMFSRDLANNYGDMIKGPKGESVVKNYVDESFRMAATANELLKRAGESINKWANVKDVDKLNELAWKSTVMGINPDEPISATNSNKHLVIEGKVANDVRQNHADLRAAWEKLSPEGKSAYKSTRALLADNWSRRERALNKQVADTYNPIIDQARADGNEAKARQLMRERDDLIREFGIKLSRVNGPYFPLMRFGDYFVNFKSPEYVQVETKLNEASEQLRSLMNKLDLPTLEERRAIEKANPHLSEEERIKTRMTEDERKQVAEARKKVQELEDKLSGMRDKEQHYSSESFETESAATKRAQELNVPVRRAAEHFRELNPLTRAFMERMQQSLEASLPSADVQAAREALAKLYLQTLPDTSAMKNQMKRENVAGFSTNMTRNIAAYTRREAHYLSRLEHMDELTSSLMQMERGAKASDNPLKATELYNEMAKRHVASMNYTETPIQDAIARLSFAYQLGVSPAFLLTNMTQPWMLSAPMLASRHGLHAVGELGRAFGEVGKNLTTAMRENGIHTELNLKKFNPAERKMLEDAQKQGLLDVTMEADLGAYERGSDPSSKLSRFSRALSVAPHQVEVVNRAMTALAAFRMELAKTGSEETASKYAQDVLAKTHFDYSNINAPRPFRPGVLPFGKLITQYRKYQMGVISLLANQAKQMVKGATPEERSEARRALVSTVGLHLLMAGAMGVPGAATVMGGMNLAHKLFGDDDEPFDAESSFRTFMADTLGVEGGAVFSKGLPVLAGLDLSKKIGLGDVFQPVKMNGSPKTYQDLGKEMLIAGLGPAVGQGLNMLQGLDYMGNGQYNKAIESFLPKSVADLFKSVRYGTEGITNRKGQVSIEPDRVGYWDQAIAALGFTPSLVSERGSAVAAVNDAKQELNDRRDKLMRDWVKAYTARDAEALIDARQAIDRFNAKRSEAKEQIIKPSDLLSSYKARQAGSKQMTPQGVLIPKKDRGLATRADFAYVS